MMDGDTMTKHRTPPPLPPLSPRLGLAIHQVVEERDRQFQKFGDQSWKPDGLWLAILMEEVGEVAHELNEVLDTLGRSGAGMSPGLTERIRIRDEIIQVAAVAIAWLEAAELRVWGEENDPGQEVII